MQKFNYTPTNPFSGSLSSLAIGAGMVIVPLVYPFGIRIGRMPILGATATTAIFVVGGLALLAFTARVDGERVTIPMVKKGAVTNESFRLPDVEYTKFDAEENEFTISLPTDHYVIRGAFFENSDAFDTFKSIFSK